MEDKGSRKVDYFTARYSLFKENQMHINDILNPQTKEDVYKRQGLNHGRRRII